ncbi:HlyD family type I secretion periplasmic adaptor subunit [Microvirga tunisiensis]|uniref:Membrane fusion protein (MFP) family protein n=1 Tax=Microvirga tunisiensis TaxID=2108360 RepID=A0A5N7MIY8_9HYPH|nr:HlyD family type I secretion periplasmic adaptor subunit [Microvirga tunisiensis]MPR08702.1 HlyD family type I secretion periplasmic adaptor subunit [Microvirga tunisiensis]MPR26907.1 HlyD family type I secretion periplasmic adaptor subunit [Microvirga tunisiensis]
MNNHVPVEALAGPTFKDSASGPVMFGGVAALALVSAVMAWSSTMSVASASISSGKVAVEGNRKAVQHPTGGEVGVVSVREGQLVAKGQKLVQLELADAKAEATVLGSSRAAALLRAARLQAERTGSADIAFPGELLGQKTDPQVQMFLQQEQALLTARRAAYLGQISLLNQQIEGNRRQIIALRERSKAAQTQLESVESELLSLQPLLERGLIARPRVLTLERTAAGLRGDISAVSGMATAEEDKIRAAEIQIEQLTKERLENIARESGENDARLAEIEPRLISAQRRLEQSVIVAPEDGYVYGLSVFGPGATLTPGQVALEIVPKDDPLVVAVEIDPTDVNRVRPGQRASIYFLPYRQRYSKPIYGTLEKVSADRFDDKMANRTYYKGIVKVDPKEVEQAHVDMTPGMPAQVTIETGTRTILAYFLDPVLKIYDFALKEQ